MKDSVLDTEFTPKFSSDVLNKSNSVDDIIARAYDLYDQKKYNDVISLIQKTPSISNSSVGHVLIGNSYFCIGDSKNALSYWKKAIEISSLENIAYVNIGNYYYSKGKYYDAIYNWSVSTTIVPENPTVNLNLALAYDKINSRIKATKYFEKYLRYEKNKDSADYNHVKQYLFNMTAKVEFYTKKIQEYKDQRDLKSIAALYLKIISTYALVPAVYNNIADIFKFDNNYEKALDFYQVIYLYFPFTNKILIEMANLCYQLKQLSYAYVYYHRAIKTLPESTSYYNKVDLLMKSLEFVKDDPELVQSHLDKAKEAEQRCDYEVAVDEYENYMILTGTESDDLQQRIDKYKIFVNPEKFVVTVLHSQLSDLMMKKDLNTCVEFCDRIITMGQSNSVEVSCAIKLRSECKCILASRHS